jgi:hypothetical protein
MLSTKLTFQVTPSHHSSLTNSLHQKSGAIGWLLMLTCISVLAGCGGSAPEYYIEDNSAPKGTSGSVNLSPMEGNDDGNSCQHSMLRVYDALNPENLGVQSDRSAALIFLREWSRECGKDEKQLPDLNSTLLTALGEGTLTNVNRKEFDGRDIYYLRDALLCSKIANYLSSDAKNDMERMLRVHDFVMNNVAYSPDFSTVPRSCFEILKYGRGVRSDRNWLFANLLRQLNMEAFLISGTPPADAKDQAPQSIIGVLAGGQVYLFDPFCSAPIPSLKDPGLPFVTVVATWNEFREHPELISNMISINEVDHPLAKFDFSKPQAHLITTSSLFANRMKKFQIALVGMSNAVVYQELSGSPHAALESIVTGMNQTITAEQVSIWDYPENMTLRFENPQPGDEDVLRQWAAAFDTTSETVRSTTDRQEQVQQKKTQEKQFLLARMHQLTGDFEAALSSYTLIRLGMNNTEVEPGTSNPKLVLFMRQRMGLDAHFWTATAQMTQQKYAPAKDNLALYLNRYGQTELTLPAVSLLGICLAKQNDLKSAVGLLTQNLNQQDPNFRRNLFYSLRWAKIIQPPVQEKKEDVKKEETKKEEPKQDEPKPDDKKPEEMKSAPEVKTPEAKPPTTSTTPTEDQSKEPVKPETDTDTTPKAEPSK